MKSAVLSAGIAATLLLSACANEPLAPSVAVMPPSGKPFEQFQNDDLVCRNFAQNQVGTNPNTLAHAQEATGAVAGAALGAVAGSLIGGGHQAAGVGAGLGLLGGSMVGAGSADQSGASLQRRYDIAYEQCMYSKGNVLPSVRQSNYGNPQTVILMPPNNGYPAQAPATPPPPPPK